MNTDAAFARAPKILVVDDEQHFIDTVCRGLFLFGYRCVGARGVGAALAALTGDDDDPCDLALTDITKPGSFGVELLERIWRERPKLPVVVITGLAATPELSGLERAENVALLHKPFEPDALDAVIRRALDRFRSRTA